MTENISIALEVLGVGMVTVFVILGLVVLSGHLLIKIINRYFPAIVVTTSSTRSRLTKKEQEASSSPSKSTLAAIVASVDLITEGKGKVSKIERMDN